MTELVLHAGLPLAGGTVLRRTVFPRLPDRLVLHSGKDSPHRAFVRGLNRFYHGHGSETAALEADGAFDAILAQAGGRGLLLSNDNLTVRASGFWLEGYQDAASVAERTHMRSGPSPVQSTTASGAEGSM